MKPFWGVVRTSFKAWLRDRSAVFWGIFFPLLLMGLIGSVFGGVNNVQFSLSLPKELHDPLAQGIVSALKSIPNFDVVQEERQTGLDALNQGDRTLVLVIPDDLTKTASTGLAGGAPAQVTAYYSQANAQTAQAALAIVREVLHQAGARLAQRPEVLALATKPVQGQTLTLFDFLLPGIMAMTIMQSGLMGVATVITEYRERLVLKRVLATPVRPLTFIAGLITRYTATTLLQVVVIFLVGTFVYHAHVIGSLALLFALGLLGSAVFLSLGFLISTLSKTSESANLVGSVSNFLMMFLSGVFWPTEFLPAAIRPIVAALPLSPLVAAMRGVATGSEHLMQFAPGLLYLLAWGVVAFGITAWRFRWE